MSRRVLQQPERLYAYKETNDGFTVREIIGEDRYTEIMAKLYNMKIVGKVKKVA